MLLLGFHNTPVTDHDPGLFISLSPGDGEEVPTVRDTGEPYVLGLPERTGLLASNGEVLLGDSELFELRSSLGHRSPLGSLTAPASVRCVDSPVENGRGFA